MPSASRSTTPVGIDMDAVEGRYAELDDHTVSFETFKQDLDVAPYFRGLPGDACTCLHLGYVTAGQITFRWPDHEETYVEGDAYVAPPGHRPLIAAGTSVVEFSLTADLQPVMETIGRNIEAMAGARVMTALDTLPAVDGGLADLAQAGRHLARDRRPARGHLRSGRVHRPEPPAVAAAGQGVDGAFRLREEPHPQLGRCGSRRWTARRAASCSSSRSGGRPRASSGTAAS